MYYVIAPSLPAVYYLTYVLLIVSPEPSNRSSTAQQFQHPPRPVSYAPLSLFPSIVGICLGATVVEHYGFCPFVSGLVNVAKRIGTAQLLLA